MFLPRMTHRIRAFFGSIPLNILLVGKGGREHAIAWKISRSPILSELYLWPGNPVSVALGTPADLPASASFSQLAVWAKNHAVDLVISGPEAPLSEGLADVMAEHGIPVFGPRQAGAMLEASKAFAKEVMQAAGVPTAASRLVTGENECRQVALVMLKETGGTVLKASGLAAGKGVFVCTTEAEIEEGLRHLYHSDMSTAAEKVVVEEILHGRECSYFTFIGDGESRGLGFAVDFKRLQDGNKGPNTGGMGSYTPVPWLPVNAGKKVEDLVVRPLMKELAKRDIPYTGCLYVGLMWHPAKGPQVVEFNVRLGDPEAQILAVYDDRDWLALMADRAGLTLPAAAASDLNRSVAHDDKVVGVVLASDTYPYGKDAGATGELPAALFAGEQNFVVFAASVAAGGNGGFVSATGRVLTVVGRGTDFAAARKKAYDGVAAVRRTWTGCHFRNDIALNAQAPLDL
jgi:phosphoribosylamine--glycine ligase